MFSRTLSLKTLSPLCRSLSTLLHSGVEITKAFKIAGDKARDAQARDAMHEIQTSLKKGDDIAGSMRSTGVFPELMIEMVAVAEQTGTLPEILHSLSEHYEHHVRLRRDFTTAIAWPVFQYLAATFVIAGMLYVIGIIGQMNRTATMDVLGFGLTGGSGAMIWLTITLGGPILLFVAYQLLARGFEGKRILDPLLLRIPVVGQCLQSFAVARFSWAFSLTQQAGMPIEASLDASFRATANGAFLRVMPEAIDDVMTGDTLTEALAGTRVFPVEWIEMVSVGEASGTVPEMLQRMSPQFEDQARRTLRALAVTLGWVIWGMVAIFIIMLVFRIALMYRDLLIDAGKGF
ncbi:MAG: type II secretion system F family protein [Planctomycetota bacterium]|nr:type II secretion system F family protein [Planctomycetota bacterium]MDA1212948.1 type II secretion system F family protein [Planctomycetota bacterium]